MFCKFIIVMIKKIDSKNMDRDDYLKLISLKIIKPHKNTVYLTNLNETFKHKIYSESATHIRKGIYYLKDEGLISFNSYEDKLLLKQVIYNLNRKKCEYCKKGFKPRNNAQKYCSNNCRKFAKLEQDEKSKQKQRKNPNYYEKQLGNSNLGPHANKNNEMEKISVRKEYNRIFNDNYLNP